MIIAELTVIPIGTKKPSVSKEIAAAIAELKRRGFKPLPTAMGTIVEAKEMKEILSAIEIAHEAVFKTGAKRAATSVRIDERRDKEGSVERKLKAVKGRMEK